MTVAIIGWGSLIWSPRDLPIDGEWRPIGPRLPVEFSRVADDGRLTLAIDPVHGEGCLTYVVPSPRSRLDTAVRDLAARERAESGEIGWIDPASGRRWDGGPEGIAETIAAWASGRDLTGVAWTGLAPNFAEVTGRPFTPQSAAGYLEDLPEPAVELAHTYIRRAPGTVSTPLRRHLAGEDPVLGGG